MEPTNLAEVRSAGVVSEKLAAPLVNDPPDSANNSSQRYTIDELTVITGVASRTIRFYQASGALPAPERHGRQAYYGPQHVERLRLVAELQDRGLNLKAIRDLLSLKDAGDVKVSDWLGVGDQLRAPWSEDRPRVFSEAELRELFGAGHRPGLLAELVRSGLVRREGNAVPASYFVQSPEFLRMALQVDAAGVPLEDAARAIAILRRRLARATRELVQLFVARSERRKARVSPDEITRSVQALRAVGPDAVRLVFAQEIERALLTLMDAGHVPRGHKTRGAGRRSKR